MEEVHLRGRGSLTWKGSFTRKGFIYMVGVRLHGRGSLASEGFIYMERFI